MQGFPFAATWRSVYSFGAAEMPATFGIAERFVDGSTKFCAGVGPPRQRTAANVMMGASHVPAVCTYRASDLSQVLRLSNQMVIYILDE